MKKISRRDFIKKSTQFGLAATVGGHFFHNILTPHNVYAEEGIDIAVVIGENYLESTKKAVVMFGGMEKFVPNGAKVAILPNSQSRHPGTFTKPDIVRAVIQMCKNAGAGEVNCLSWLNMRNWESTGLAEVVKSEGAHLKLVAREETNFKTVPLSKAKLLKEAKIMNEFFANDVFINMPITKDHVGNKFTGTLKNYMGLNAPFTNRFFHTGTDNKPDNIEHLDQCIADLNLALKPTLCIVDATEFITTNGPFGPGKLIKPNKVVVGVDRVAIDAYCVTLWGLNSKDIIMIQRAYEHGLGEIDLNKVNIKEESL